MDTKIKQLLSKNAIDVAIEYGKVRRADVCMLYGFFGGPSLSIYLNASQPSNASKPSF